MTETRFHIAFLISTLNQVANNPAPEHVAALKSIFWYLKKYSSLGIMYKKEGPLSLHKHVDSDWKMDLISNYPVFQQPVNFLL